MRDLSEEEFNEIIENCYEEGIFCPHEIFIDVDLEKQTGDKIMWFKYNDFYYLCYYICHNYQHFNYEDLYYCYEYDNLEDLKKYLIKITYIDDKI